MSSTWSYNKLLGFADAEYEYDENGNMTQKKVGTAAVNYIYDAADRLIKVEDDLSGTLIAEYYYDPFGRRLWKDVGGTKTYFFYSEEGLIAEYDASGTELRSYGYKPDSTWTTDPLFQKVGSTYYWYQNDHLGTPQKLTAQDGTVVWSAQYTAFGEAEIQVETVTNNLRFPGQYEDTETGLHYNLQRYYAPQTGRYLQKDPMNFFGGTINLYGYASNNPLNRNDPYGLTEVIDRPLTQEEIEWLKTALDSLGKGGSSLVPMLIKLGGKAGLYGLAAMALIMMTPQSDEMTVPEEQAAIQEATEQHKQCCEDDAGQLCDCETMQRIVYYVILPGRDPSMEFGHAFLGLPMGPGVGVGWFVRDTSDRNIYRVLRGRVVKGKVSDDTTKLHHKDRLPLRKYHACPSSVAAVGGAVIANSGGEYHLYNQLARNCYGWAAKVLFDVGFVPPISPYQSFEEFRGSAKNPFERLHELTVYLFSLAR